MATKAAEAVIPPLAILAASLRRVTETLVSEIDSPSPSPPPWSEFDWGIARAVVSIHGTAGVLLRNLKWTESTWWRVFLAAEVAQTRDQHSRMTTALEEIDSLAKAAHIPVMMLKGCALHAMEFYEAGERPMADIDLLVRAADETAMTDLLQRAGFKLQGSSWKHKEFARDSQPWPVKLDVHVRLAERLGHRVIELPNCGLDFRVGGVRGYGSRAALLRHLLLHTAGNMSSRWVRAIHLHDIARLSERLDSSDWQELRSHAWPERWCLYPPLLLASRYFPAAVQPETLEDLAVVCPRFLAIWARRRQLTDISASNPRIMALPALAWCTSAAAVITYIKARLFPDRTELDGFRDLARTTEFGTGQRWFTMSQPARVMTWLLRRNIRPGTLHAVRNGLGSTQAS